MSRTEKIYVELSNPATDCDVVEISADGACLMPQRSRRVGNTEAVHFRLYRRQEDLQACMDERPARRSFVLIVAGQRARTPFPPSRGRTAVL